MTRLRRDVSALLLLTFTTGLIDAVSYLALDQVFTGNMTGNVLFIGFALTGVDGIPLLNNLVAMAGFLVGSVISGRIVPRGRADDLDRRALSTLFVCALMMAVVALIWLLVGTEPLAVELSMTSVLAAAMGAQVSAVKPLGNSDITTIVVTNTLANLARDSRLAGGRGQAWIQRLGAVVCMAAGAFAGSLLLVAGDGPLAVGVAAVIITVVVVLLSRRPRRA